MDPIQFIRAALTHFNAGRRAEAQGLARRALAIDPGASAALYLLGLCAAAQDEHAAAARIVLRSTRTAGAHLEAALASYASALANAASALGRNGDSAAAAAACRQALAINPNHVEALATLAAATSQTDGDDPAARILKRAVRLEPQRAENWRNLAKALLGLKRYDGSRQAFKQLLALTPEESSAYVSLGYIAVAAGGGAGAVEAGAVEAGAAAEASYRRALRLTPNPSIAGDLSVLSMQGGRIDEAMALARRAAALEPEKTETWIKLGCLHLHVGAADAAIIFTRRALALQPSHAEAHSNILILHEFIDAPPLRILAEHRRFDAMHGRPRAACHRRHDNDPDPDRKLRVGYVSSDFRQHVASCFFEPLLAAHDPARVETFCYSDTPSPDAVTRRLIALAGNWRDVLGRREAELADMIRADRIDILVDLAGHSAGNRMTVFARRPAPVLATWLGYPDTSGLAAMDYRLVDAVTDPEGPADGLASETLVRIPGGFLCYWPPVGTPEPGPAVADRPLTFGSFNKLAKITPAVIDAWADILRRLPGARLLLKSLGLADDGVRGRVEAAFAARGVAPDRLELIGWSASWLDHLALYRRIDVALDSFPYNGTTTTCEALWMGAPVVTWLGERHAARVGASLLRRIGLPELVGADVKDYKDIAVRLAADGPRLAALRAGLRERMRASPLCDAPAFARNMEGVYADLWRRWSKARREEAAFS